MRSIHTASRARLSQGPGRGVVQAVAMLALLLAPVAGHCMTWDYLPTIIVGTRYETNPNYVNDSDLEDDAYAGVLDTTLDIRAETQRARLGLEPQVRLSYYMGAEND